ncbi:hypothetical protein M3P05_12840 [Sansalvadorimonas sp. 2012CJ34-2]|uniref:Uncharacterized protein n=1 Tax=Parendozoicomonas callyspongiae TaxID=2942213 RepID=A0ABT0PHU0_9GAMM|nr:hypothetical protein [Sansalvadorimonas sp. 2012CJ34-2]MCL6270811.1 hypothetical protein [Sansalvadorimonas sp. 2012CJ34-2]
MQPFSRSAQPLDEYLQPYSEIGLDSPSRNRSNEQKHLPNAPQKIEHESYQKKLKSRCTSSVSTKKDNSYYAGIAKALISKFDPVFFDSIDEESWKNMADSLMFSGVDSLDKAIAMDLRLCPPCPVFHTWVGLYGTTIFNGSNNPKKLAGINYVERILGEATDLSKHDIPLLIVFSEMNLTKNQIDEMKAEFEIHNNILLVSFETELQLKFIVELEKHAKSMCVEFMDSIRVVVSQSISKVITFCIEKAISERKMKLAKRLEKCGVNYLFYSDIDNQWLSKPPYILARHGIFTQPKLSITLPLISIDGDVVEKLSDIDKHRLMKHRSFFSEIPYFDKSKSWKWSTEKAKKLFDYILSGEAECNFKYLSEQLAHISPHYNYLLKPDEGVYWEGENSCFFVSEHSKDVFLRGALKRPWLIDLHQKPKSESLDDAYNPDRYYKEAHSLVGMQLLKYYYHGHDFTWFFK